MEYKPEWQYKIYNVPAYYTRGAFHAVSTGRFMGYANQVKKTAIEILMQNCPNCNAGRVWIDAEDLERAEGCLECEYCDFVAYPVDTGDLDEDLIPATN